jgi:hypothetical protein
MGPCPSAIGRHPPREEGAPQPAELLAGQAEQLGRSLIGFIRRLDDDPPTLGRARVLAPEVAVADVREVVEQLLLREEQQMIRSVPRRRLLDDELDDAVSGDGDAVDGAGIQDAPGFVSRVTQRP